MMNTTMNSKVAEDWEDLLDVCDPDSIDLMPFERVPTPSVPLSYEDEMLSGDEENIDPESAKQLQGMLTYTLRTLGTDYTNSSIEMAFGMNGKLLRTISPEIFPKTPSEHDTESRIVPEENETVTVSPEYVDDNIMSVDNIDVNSPAVLLSDNDTVTELKEDDCQPVEGLAMFSSKSIPPISPPIGNHSNPKDDIQMSQSEMVSIAKRVKRNVALSSIMATLMNQNSELLDETPQKTAVIDLVDNKKVTVEPGAELTDVEDKLIGKSFASDKFSNGHFQSSDESDRCGRMESVSPPASMYRTTVKNRFNIFDKSVAAEQAKAHIWTSNSVQSTVPDKVSPHAYETNKITLNTSSARKPVHKLSEEEIYNNLLENLSKPKPKLAAHYSTDSFKNFTPVKPRITTVFDIAQVEIAKLKKK